MWGMEVIDWTPAWLWYLLAVCLLVYLWGIWPYITTSIKLPGPKPAPFFGNMIQLSREGILQSDLVNLKKYGRVYLSWLGRNPTINIVDPDMVRQICVKEFARFTNRASFGPLSPMQKSMVVFMLDERWKFVRSILSPTFSSGKLRQMGPIIDTCLNRLTENVSQYCQTGESFEVKSVMDGLAMEVIGAVGFGIQMDTQKDLNNQFVYYAKKAFQGNAITRLPVIISSLFPFLTPVCEAIGLTTEDKDFTAFAVKMLTDAIKERRREPTKKKDLLQLILDSSVDDLKETLTDKDVDVDALKLNNVKGNEKLSDLEVIAQTIIFLFAGFDTTSSSLTYLAYNLAVYPECQEKLIQEIDDALQGAAPTYNNVMSLPYLDKCWNETQRLYPAVRGLARVSPEPVVINGIHIPANTRVVLQAYALQRDATYWPDPEKFDPERWSPEQKAARHPYAFFPFGVGPRNCVGMRLALMEAKLAAVAILQKFRFVRTPETQVPLTFKKGIFVQPEKGIMLGVKSRD